MKWLLRDEINRINGISFVVCQEHYDMQTCRGRVLRDEIGSENECALCKSREMRRQNNETHNN